MKLQALGEYILLKVVAEKKEEQKPGTLIIPDIECNTPIYEILDFLGDLSGYRVGDHVILGSYAQKVNFKKTTYHIAKKETVIAKVLGD